MDLFLKRDELIGLIREFLAFHAEVGALTNFAWEIITAFSSGDRSALPDEQKFEPEFWYAVWQIQHLAGESDERMLREHLEKTLTYLEGKAALPKDYAGSRPSVKRNG